MYKSKPSFLLNKQHDIKYNSSAKYSTNYLKGGYTGNNF